VLSLRSHGDGKSVVKRQPIERSHVLFQSIEKASLAGKEALAQLIERLSKKDHDA